MWPTHPLPWQRDELLDRIAIVSGFWLPRFHALHHSRCISPMQRHRVHGLRGDFLARPWSFLVIDGPARSPALERSRIHPSSVLGNGCLALRAGLGSRRSRLVWCVDLTFPSSLPPFAYPRNHESDLDDPGTPDRLASCPSSPHRARSLTALKRVFGVRLSGSSPLRLIAIGFRPSPRQRK